MTYTVNEVTKFFSEEAMIEVKNLKMSYGKTEVLNDISFTIENGKTVGLLGANGAGKTTTMNILTGYLKPTSGDVCINDINLRKMPKLAKQYIGYLPEHPPLYKDMKVLEYLLFVAELKGVKDKKEEVQRVLQIMNLEERQLDFIKKLSKGMQQRIGFAQAILGSPEVLILDEPLVGLDPAEAKRTRELIRKLKGECIIIISSHILTEIEELCDTVLMLKDGHIVLDDTTTDAKRRGNKNVYRLVIKGDCDSIYETLQCYDALKEIHLCGEKEPGVFEYILKTKNARDIRDSILGYLGSKKYSVYGIEKIETSLEDVFIKMNQKEEE